MSRRTVFALMVWSLALLLAGSANAGSKKQNLDELSAEILESLQSFYPVNATGMGIHAYDHRLADFSSKSVNNMRKKLDDYSRKLYKYRNTTLSTEDRINYQLINSNVNIALLDLKQIKWHTKSPQLYIDEAVNGIYFLMLSKHAPMSEKLYSILARMKAVPALVATARKNIQKPPEVYLDLAGESLESAIRFYHEVAGELMNQFPDRADEILRVSTAAREAMSDFAIYLSSIEPGDPTSFAIGKKNYDYMLEQQFFLDIDSDSLLKIGESLLAAADEEYRQYEEYVEENYQNGKDSVFVPASFCRQDILDYYQWETDQVRVFIEENDLITIPEDIAPVTVVETPAFLRSMIGGIAYQPAGPFDENQNGYFYIRPVPEDLDASQLAARYRYVHRRGFKGSVVHEAYPGHHLQMQLAGRHEHPVRRWQMNNMFCEGWALYCEEMMYAAGLYGDEDPSQWLAILGGIRFRAARIVADVKLHTGQFTFEECVDWMIDVLDADTESAKEYHRTMVRKYTLTPTVWMSYLMGKQEIERLHDAAMARPDMYGSEREFHDALLSEGTIPPALLWDALGLK